MITSDPQQRAERLARLREILAAQAAPEDRELLLAFAPVVYFEMPDRIALGLPLEALAARMLDHFRFVAREIPPPTQLYRGLPGIHVAARNPDEADGVRHGRRPTASPWRPRSSRPTPSTRPSSSRA